MCSSAKKELQGDGFQQLLVSERDVRPPGLEIYHCHYYNGVFLGTGGGQSPAHWMSMPVLGKVRQRKREGEENTRITLALPHETVRQQLTSQSER